MQANNNRITKAIKHQSNQHAYLDDGRSLTSMHTWAMVVFFSSTSASFVTTAAFAFANSSLHKAKEQSINTITIIFSHLEYSTLQSQQDRSIGGNDDDDDHHGIFTGHMTFPSPTNSIKELNSIEGKLRRRLTCIFFSFNKKINI